MMMRAKITALTILAALVLAGCGSQSTAGDRVEGNDSGFVAGDGSITLVDASERIPAPDLVGETLDGETLRLTDYRGSVVVLNVWASWCAPCRAEAPTLERVWRDTQTDGVQFIGLDTRDSVAAAKAFVDNYGITYPNVIDNDGKLQLLFRESLPPQAIPSTIVIDAEGRVAGRILGAVSESTLRGLIEPLLEESQ